VVPRDHGRDRRLDAKAVEVRLRFVEQLHETLRDVAVADEEEGNLQRITRPRSNRVECT
jgi:hypothetical protein